MDEHPSDIFYLLCQAGVAIGMWYIIISSRKKDK